MQSRCVDRLVYWGVGFDFAQGASKEKDIQYLTRSNARDDLDLLRIERSFRRLYRLPLVNESHSIAKANRSGTM